MGKDNLGCLLFGDDYELCLFFLKPGKTKMLMEKVIEGDESIVKLMYKQPVKYNYDTMILLGSSLPEV